MVDNTQLDPGSGGDLIATDDIADGGVANGAKVQRVKLGFGTNGNYTEVSSSDPYPSREEPLDARFKVYQDTNFVSGDSPALLDVDTDLGRKGRTVIIVNDGPGAISVKLSNDGVTFSDAWPMATATERLELENITIDQIEITWVSDSSYRVLVA